MADERSLRIVATFERDADLLAAIRAARAQGFAVHEVFAPYVVHGIEEALDAPPSRLPWVTLAGGFLGLLIAALFQFWAADVDWPLNVGGKPANSGLAFLPITFEATVLLGGLATAAAFFWRSGLGPGFPPKLAVPGVTDDVLALVVDVQDGTDDEQRLRSLLTSAGAAAIRRESA
jgi:ActD protein